MYVLIFCKPDFGGLIYCMPIMTYLHAYTVEIWAHQIFDDDKIGVNPTKT